MAENTSYEFLEKVVSPQLNELENSVANARSELRELKSTNENILEAKKQEIDGAFNEKAKELKAEQNEFKEQINAEQNEFKEQINAEQNEFKEQINAEFASELGSLKDEIELEKTKLREQTRATKELYEQSEEMVLEKIAASVAVNNNEATYKGVGIPNIQCQFEGLAAYKSYFDEKANIAYIRTEQNTWKALNTNENNTFFGSGEPVENKTDLESAKKNDTYLDIETMKVYILKGSSGQNTWVLLTANSTDFKGRGEPNEQVSFENLKDNDTFFSSEENKLYRYNGSAWLEISVPNVITQKIYKERDELDALLRAELSVSLTTTAAISLTTSGTWVVPKTGVYRFHLIGGGGGGLPVTSEQAKTMRASDNDGLVRGDNFVTDPKRINTEQLEAGSPYPTPVSSNKLPQHGDGANALSQTDERGLAQALNSTHTEQVSGTLPQKWLGNNKDKPFSPLSNENIPQKPLKTADDEDIIGLVPDENRVYSVVFNGPSQELSKMGVEIAKGEIKSAGAKKLIAIAENSANEVANEAEQIISANIAKINDSSIEIYANNINILNEVAKKYPMLSKSEQIELANKQIMANASPELLAYTKAINGGELPSDARLLGTNASRLVAKSLEMGVDPRQIRDMLLKAGIKGDLATALAKMLKSRDISAFNESISAAETRLRNEAVENARATAKNESIGQILDAAKAKAIENDELLKKGVGNQGLDDVSTKFASQNSGKEFEVAENGFGRELVSYNGKKADDDMKRAFSSWEAQGDKADISLNDGRKVVYLNADEAMELSAGKGFLYGEKDFDALMKRKQNESLDERFARLQTHPAYENMLKMRENTKASELKGERILAQRSQVYQDQESGKWLRTKTLSDPNPERMISISKADVAKLRAGNIDEALLIKLENSLEALTADPNASGVLDHLLTRDFHLGTAEYKKGLINNGIPKDNAGIPAGRIPKSDNAPSAPHSPKPDANLDGLPYQQANSTPNEIKSQGGVKWAQKFKAKMAKMGQEYSDEKIANLANWHKNSHAITKEADGSPKVFYHTTTAKKPFEFFDYNKQYENNPIGHYFFNNNTDYGDGIKYKVYLKIKKPFIHGELTSQKQDEIFKIYPELKQTFENMSEKGRINLLKNAKRLSDIFKSAKKLGFENPKIWKSTEFFAVKNGKYDEYYDELPKTLQNKIRLFANNASDKIQAATPSEYFFNNLSDIRYFNKKYLDDFENNLETYQKYLVEEPDITYFRKAEGVYNDTAGRYREHKIKVSRINNQERLKSFGYDGVQFSDTEFVAFSPNQIKSIDNSGAFNPRSKMMRGFSTVEIPSTILGGAGGHMAGSAIGAVAGEYENEGGVAGAIIGALAGLASPKAAAKIAAKMMSKKANRLDLTKLSGQEKSLAIDAVLNTLKAKTPAKAQKMSLEEAKAKINALGFNADNLEAHIIKNHSEKDAKNRLNKLYLVADTIKNFDIKSIQGADNAYVKFWVDDNKDVFAYVVTKQKDNYIASYLPLDDIDKLKNRLLKTEIFESPSNTENSILGTVSNAKSQAHNANSTPNELKSQGGGGYGGSMKKGFSTQAINEAILNAGSGVAGGNIAMANEDDPNKKAQAFIMGFLAGFGGAKAASMLAKNAPKLAPQLARASEKMASELPRIFNDRPDILGGVLGKINNAKDNFKNIFGGEKALGANKAKLEEAQAMLKNGADESEVWAKTGWYKDIDGKWKFEINPKGGELKTPENNYFTKEHLQTFKQEYIDKKMTFAELKEFSDKNGGQINTQAIAKAYYLPENTSIEEIAKRFPHTKMSLENYIDGGLYEDIFTGSRINSARAMIDGNIYPGLYRLDDILDDEALFKAYPQLKDMRVSVANTFDPIVKGKFRKNSNEIILSDELKKDELKSVLYHELQHAVQKIEGFAGGAEGTKISKDVYLKTAGEVEARNVETRINMLENADKEAQKIVEMIKDPKKAMAVSRDLANVDDYVRLSHGNYKVGAKHINLRHASDPQKIGYVSDDEISRLGENMRKFLLKHKEPYFDNTNNTFVYEWVENGNAFRLVTDSRSLQLAPFNRVGTSAKDEIITFFSNRNLKSNEPYKFKNPEMTWQKATLPDSQLPHPNKTMDIAPNERIVSFESGDAQNGGIAQNSATDSWLNTADNSHTIKNHFSENSTTSSIKSQELEMRKSFSPELKAQYEMKDKFLKGVSEQKATLSDKGKAELAKLKESKDSKLSRDAQIMQTLENAKSDPARYEKLKKLYLDENGNVKDSIGLC